MPDALSMHKKHVVIFQVRSEKIDIWKAFQGCLLISLLINKTLKPLLILRLKFTLFDVKLYLASSISFSSYFLFKD